MGFSKHCIFSAKDLNAVGILCDMWLLSGDKYTTKRLHTENNVSHHPLGYIQTTWLLR